MVLLKFMTEFTVEKLSTSWLTILISFAIALVMLPIVLLVSRFLTKDRTEKNAYIYGLCFSNFGFMGNAIVLGLFGQDILFVYLIFTLPFWAGIYTWGVPALLMPATEGKRTLWQRIKPFVNPMFIAMIIGIILGLLPFSGHEYADFGFFGALVKDLGNCMSPIAMVLTGMTIAKIDLKATLKNATVYTTSLIRLVAIPLATVFVLRIVLQLFPSIPRELSLCIVCALSMPLGLSAIVIPSGYGMDTTAASGMALVSHFLSCITIPLVFLLAQGVGILPVF